jgi:hypothetical protein
MRRPLVSLGACALALALFSAPASAGPELGTGDAAVPFEGKDFVNTDPLTFKDMRGRVILLELFSTT